MTKVALELRSVSSTGIASVANDQSDVVDLSLAHAYGGGLVTKQLTPSEARILGEALIACAGDAGRHAARMRGR